MQNFFGAGHHNSFPALPKEVETVIEVSFLTTKTLELPCHVYSWPLCFVSLSDSSQLHSKGPNVQPRKLWQFWKKREKKEHNQLWEKKACRMQQGSLSPYFLALPSSVESICRSPHFPLSQFGLDSSPAEGMGGRIGEGGAVWAECWGRKHFAGPTPHFKFLQGPDQGGGEILLTDLQKPGPMCPLPGAS